jgi:hypothetical protein
MSKVTAVSWVRMKRRPSAPLLLNGCPIVENLLKEEMVVKIGEVEFVFRGASQ